MSDALALRKPRRIDNRELKREGAKSAKGAIRSERRDYQARSLPFQNKRGELASRFYL